MSAESDARQEAERRWPDAEAWQMGVNADREWRRRAFIAGAVWAREQDTRKPSEDPCPEWKCPDLSSEDRREGKTCPDHPCTCTGEPSDATLKESAPDLTRPDDMRSGVAYPSAQ